MTFNLYTLLVGLTLIGGANSFYLPGVYPHNYAESEPIKLQVNSLSSVSTVLPKDVYKFPFCKPVNDKGKIDIIHEKENLGEFLSGDTIQNSPYKWVQNVLKGQEMLSGGWTADTSVFSGIITSPFHHRDSVQ